MRESSWNPTLATVAMLVSGGLWAAFITLQYAAFDFAKQTTGIGLIFIPAGVRLGLILVFGWWGALGVALSNILVFGDEFNAKSILEVLVISLIAGFAPLIAVRATFKLLKIKGSLAGLRPLDLPILSLAAAVASAVAHNLAFTALGYQGAGEWIANVTTMAFGDFLGCLVVVVLMWLAIFVYRRAKRKS